MNKRVAVGVVCVGGGCGACLGGLGHHGNDSGLVLGPFPSALEAE